MREVVHAVAVEKREVTEKQAKTKQKIYVQWSQLLSKAEFLTCNFLFRLVDGK